MYEDEEPTPLSSAIVLAEDKKYYPSAEEARAASQQRAACGSCLCAVAAGTSARS
jgi:hypothetical protein